MSNSAVRMFRGAQGGLGGTGGVTEVALSLPLIALTVRGLSLSYHN